MATVVIIGAGLGGLPTAYELRHLLPKEHRIILISDQHKFTFIPGLIRVALNLHSLEKIQVDIEQQIKPRGIEWIYGKLTSLDPYNKHLSVENYVGNTRVLEYDYVAIATGASLAFEQIPGLGPEKGYTQSVCTGKHALEARKAWLEYLENPGPLVVGAMPGAGCLGPAYEFILMADWELRQKGLRDRVSLTYITPEPYVGHLGVKGIKNAEQYTASLMQERGIQIITNTAIKCINAQELTLNNGTEIPFKYAMILPSFRGAEFLQKLPELTDKKGFIPVTPSYQHPKFNTVYALGVTVALNEPEQTPIPINLPKTGQMTEAMGLAVAHNIAVELGAAKAPLKTPTLQALCLAEFGNIGIAFIAIPMIQAENALKPQKAYALKGFWVMWVKAIFEKYFLLKMQWGLGVPWFEKLGLKMLFQLELSENLSEKLS